MAPQTSDHPGIKLAATNLLFSQISNCDTAEALFPAQL